MMKRVIVWLLCNLLRQYYFDWLIVYFVTSNITVIRQEKEAELQLLLIDPNRFRDDLTVMAQFPGWGLYGLPKDVQIKLNRLTANGPKLPIPNSEHLQLDLAVYNERRVAYYERLIPKLAKKLNISGVLASGMFHKINTEWEIACENTMIPFLAYHREGGGLDEQLTRRFMKDRVRTWRKFCGTRLLTATPLFRDILVNNDYFPSEKIEAVGMPRIDQLTEQHIQPQTNQQTNTITLFSFQHNCMISSLSIERKNYLKEGHGYLYGIQQFFPNREGFYDLFANTHGAVAEFALKNPNKNIVVKPKWNSGDWKYFIDQAIVNTTGLTASEIPNLTITDEASAIELISSSDIVIAFNSTTIAEAVLLDTPVIVPCFDEALDKYKNDVAWLNNLTIIPAKSKSELTTLLTSTIQKKTVDQTHRHRMLEEAFGFIDGKSTFRLQSAIKQCQNNMYK